MANTKIPAELSSTPGIIDNSTSTAITIDSNENLLVGSKVSIGTTSLSKVLNVVGDYENTGFYRDYSGAGIGANYVYIGRKDTNGALVEGVRISGGGDDAVAASHTGYFELAINKSGTFIPLLYSSNGTELVVNEGSVDLDFRVESNGNSHMLFVDGGNDRVGIGTSNPAEALTVNGNIGISDGKIYNGAASNSAGVSLPNSTVRIDGYNGITFHSSSTTVGSQTERMKIDSSGNVLVGAPHDGAPGLTIHDGRNLSFGTGNDNESYVNFFRQASSAAAVMATGYRRSGTANKMESSYGSSWAKSAITANYGTVRFYTDTAAADAIGTDLIPTERMRIDSSGNVGIGTSSPLDKLTVVGAASGGVNGLVKIQSNTTHTYSGTGFIGTGRSLDLIPNSNNNGDSSGIRFANPGGSRETFLGVVQSGGQGDFVVQGYNGSAYVENFRIDSSGNVGIGTNAPNDILDIRKANSQLRLTDSDDNKFVQLSYSGGKLVTRNNSTSTETAQVTLIENGNFGIGTINPEQKLHVEGRGVFDGATSSDILQIRNDSGGGVFGNSTNQFSLDLSSTSTFRVRQGSSVPFYLSASGNLHLQSASQNRIVLGSTGDDFAVNNTNNWIRGNSGSLEFNAASSGYTWECTGAPRLAMSSTGVITQTTAGTSDSYDMFLRSTDGGDPGLAITRDNVVGFGIAVRGSGNDYADLQLNTSGQTSFTEEGKIRIRGDNVTGLHGKVYVGEAESNTTDPEAVLHVRGSTMLESRVANIGLGTHTPHFTVGESGELEFMHQFVGTFTGGDTVVFTYEATSWKSWYFEVKIASTDGFYIGRAGGYNNNGGPTHNSEEGDTVMASITPSYSGQHVVVTIALDGQVHPMMKFKFACGGGEGHPKASRCKLVVNS